MADAASIEESAIYSLQRMNATRTENPRDPVRHSH
jgi:hypothetical protein